MLSVKSNYCIKVKDIGLHVQCYNGKLWIKVVITEEMCRHFIGEFLVTKKLGSAIHNKKKRKKEIKNKKWVD